MKKTLLIVLLIVMSIVLIYYNSQRDENIVRDFTLELVDESIPLEQILKKRINYTQKQKDLCLFFLKTVRDEYIKNPDKIEVTQSTESKTEIHSERIKLNSGEQLFYVQFNKSLTLPFILNKKSEIIILFNLTKGGGGNLNNSRSDETMHK
ncbi:hypothetical protein FVB9288_03096 [Flavobacterium sp. CECT 9288]|uniref:hypothetical protein n=1 Tax=Flavobacterium sp. CECT 9288 TaxID=2845819 RepID=UPI001E439C63|nr:hypothetical protein [Flavobacterium sp. CECT 9288]CAH0337341.1 hypothetical protein FVB9288_03096 [Flavobacterium sp. CECT 9288]